MKVPAPGGEPTSSNNQVPVKVTSAPAGGYKPGEAPSESNPVPVQITAGGVPMSEGSGTFKPGEPAAAANPLPVYVVAGQTVNRSEPVSAQNPLPVSGIDPYGPELITNGTFATNLSGWTDKSTAPSVFVWDAGVARASVSGGATARLDQVISGLTVGKTYRISADGTAGLFVGTTEGGLDVLPWGNGARTFVATTATVYIRSAVTTDGVTLDNVSLRLVRAAG